MISIRLVSLSKYFNYTDRVIDIGCDHALLDIYLIEHKVLKNMIVSDIHEGALKQGIDNIKKASLEEKIDTRLGNGLEVLNKKDNVNTILISGMGASTIVSILENEYVNNINKMIIQSNNDHELLREEVCKLGFKITHEEFLIDNKKSYINIVFERGNSNYNKNQLKYGPILMHNRNYLRYQMDYLNNILNKIPNNKLLIKFRLKREIRKLRNFEKNIDK